MKLKHFIKIQFKSNYYLNNFILIYFQSLYSDVTIACGSEVFQAHQLVLSSCSNYFDSILQCVSTGKHPLVILTNIQPTIFRALLQFMYEGQVSVERMQVTDVLEAAKVLQVKELSLNKDERVPVDMHSKDKNSAGYKSVLMRHRKRKMISGICNPSKNDCHINNHSTFQHSTFNILPQSKKICQTRSNQEVGLVNINKAKSFSCCNELNDDDWNTIVSLTDRSRTSESASHAGSSDETVMFTYDLQKTPTKGRPLSLVRSGMLSNVKSNSELGSSESQAQTPNENPIDLTEDSCSSTDAINIEENSAVEPKNTSLTTNSPKSLSENVESNSSVDTVDFEQIAKDWKTSPEKEPFNSSSETVPLSPNSMFIESINQKTENLDDDCSTAGDVTPASSNLLDQSNSPQVM